jgi:hypothetical protein
MIRPLLLALASAFLVGAAPRPELVEQLTRAAREADDADCVSAERRIEQVTAESGYDADPQVGATVQGIIASCAIIAKRYADAHAAIVRATGYATNDQALWLTRIALAAQVDAVDAGDVVVALERLTAMRVNLALLKDEVVWAGYRRTRSASADLGFRYVGLLYRAGWRPSKPFGSADGLWTEYAVSLAERGRGDEAARVADTVTTPRKILALSAHRAFAEQAEAAPDRFDARRAAEATLVSNRREASLNPRLLKAPSPSPRT